MTTNKTRQIPVMKPLLPTSSSLLPYLKLIDESRIYSNRGPLHNLLCDRFALLLKVERSLITTASNATVAIEGFIRIMSEVSEVWNVPVFTFPATAHAVTNSNRTLKFHDINTNLRMETQNLPISSNVIDVLPFGEAIDSVRYSKFDTGSRLIIDAAASFDAITRSTPPKFNFPYVIVVSLHPTKVPGGAEGALIYSNQFGLIDEFNKYQNFGFDSNRAVQTFGTNIKMSEYAAAVALASLDSWENQKFQWQENIVKAISTSDKLGLQPISSLLNGYISPYWNVIVSSAREAIKLSDVLNLNGVETRRWWNFGLHNEPYFEPWCQDAIFANADQLSRKIIGLPLFLDITDEDFSYIEKILANSK